jgi:hypothetical protein
MGLNGTIREVDFSTVPLVGGVNPFAGTDLSIAVVKQGAAGDGRVHVGYIDASSADGTGMDGTGIVLGNVKIGGDLGQLDVGNGPTTLAIKSLTAQTLGAWGTATQSANGSVISNFTGKVGKIKVLNSINGVSLAVAGPVAGIEVGGSFLDSSITGAGALAKIKIGAGTLGSSITAASITSMEVKGIMGAGVTLSGNLTSLKVTGDIFFARIAAFDITSVAVTGSVFGQDGVAESGAILAGGNLGKVKIGGDLRGGSATSSGRIAAAGNIESITIGGSMLGPESALASLPGNYRPHHASSIAAGGNIQKVSIGGSLVGSLIRTDLGSASWWVTSSSTIIASGDIGAVSIGGSIIGMSGEVTNTNTNVRIIGQHIGSVSIAGDFTGTGGSSDRPEIAAIGGDAKLSIGKVFIGGNMRLANIIAGARTTENFVNEPHNADGQIGSVIIRGNLQSSTIATYDAGGTNTDNVNITSKIASLAVGGFITSGSYIRAEHIAAVTLGGAVLSLQPGARNDTTGFVFAPGGATIAEFM